MINKDIIVTLNSKFGGDPIEDANNIPFSQNKLIVVRVSTSTLNIPSAIHGFIFHMNIDSADYAIQLYFPMYSDASFYARRKTNGTWQEWKINM